MKKYFKRYLIADRITDDVIYSLNQYLEIDEENDDVDIEVVPNNDTEHGYGHADGELIAIDEMIEILNDIKETGGSGPLFVAISYHGDHREYNISAFRFEEIDQPALNDRVERDKQIEELEQKIREHHAAINDILNEITKLNSGL